MSSNSPLHGVSMARIVGDESVRRDGDGGSFFIVRFPPRLAQLGELLVGGHQLG